MNKKPLYQPWSEEEFQSDIHVRAMTPFQRWMYGSLVRSAFIYSTRPYLPNDDKVLWALAGCPDYGFWQEHKKQVLDRFKVVIINGKKLLENKRVSEDWEKLEEYRVRQSERGKRSGEKRRLNAGSTLVERGFVDGSTGYEQYKDKIREDKISNVSECNESEEAGMRRRTFEAICHKNGLAPDPRSYGSWSDLASICEGLGDRVVENAFEEWASQHPNAGKPISAFVKIAPILTKKIVVVELNPRLEEFGDYVSEESDTAIIFNDAQKSKLSELLDQHPYDEIVLAFDKFFGIIKGDSYQIKFGAKDFVEKAPQILRTIRQRKAKLEQEAKQIAEIKSKVAKEGASLVATGQLDELSDEDVLRDLGFEKGA